jgi:hypothetical protein
VVLLSQTGGGAVLIFAWADYPSRPVPINAGGAFLAGVVHWAHEPCTRAEWTRFNDAATGVGVSEVGVSEVRASGIGVTDGDTGVGVPVGNTVRFFSPDGAMTNQVALTP